MGEQGTQPGCAGADEEGRRSILPPPGPRTRLPGVLPAGQPALAGPHRTRAPAGLRGRERGVQGGHGCCCQPVRMEGVARGRSMFYCEPEATLKETQEMALLK